MTSAPRVERVDDLVVDSQGLDPMQHLPGKIMVADLLTKAVARVLFASLMDLIREYAESGVACPST